MPSEWMPIESAPKDETRILAYFPDAPNWYDYSVICWSARNEQWWGCSPAAAGVVDRYSPTHWQPLPAPLDSQTVPAAPDIVDEVQRRMDAVVDAAVAWATEEDEEFDRVEILNAAVDSLLQLRATPHPVAPQGEK